MTEVVGLTAEELAAFQANPVWPIRVAAAHTIVRELSRRPVTAIQPPRTPSSRAVPVSPSCNSSAGRAGTCSRKGTAALDAALPDGRVVVLPGQKHAAHHGDPDRFVAEVERFLAADDA